MGDHGVDLRGLAPETWPARYRIHKYWGRKPANVVSGWIDHHTEPGELVLDPFCGSGVSVIEAARLGRRALGGDVNPLAVRLTNALLQPPDETEFSLHSTRVIQRVRDAMGDLFSTRCDGCGKGADLRSLGHVGSSPRLVRARCAHCRLSFSRAPNTRDVTRSRACAEAPESTPDAAIPEGWQMRKLHHAKLTRWHQLFTPRCFAAAGHLREAILDVPAGAVRDWLLITLSASLAQLTKMIPDGTTDAGGPSWKINCYWLPERWQELHPIHYFENRVARTLHALRDVRSIGAPFSTRARAVLRDSRDIQLSRGTVDYVFTDPPYGGEGIQYGELSALWCLWLGDVAELDREIACNPVRRMSNDDYAHGLRDVFDEVHRVLRPRGAMTVTFANKDRRIWDLLLDACRSTGFSLVSTSTLRRSAPALTETTMPRSPKDDVLLSFERVRLSRRLATTHEPRAIG